jgi:putative glutamine amidotransferase
VWARWYVCCVDRVRIGITSPLVGDEPPPFDISAVQHGLALGRLGAEPILLRNDVPIDGLLKNLKLAGIVFSGGGDIAPGSYGGDDSLARGDVDFRRDSFEFALMECALEARLPILATCRGMEVANVVLGGTLIEDLRHCLGDRYTIAHHQVDESGLLFGAYAHDVAVARDSALFDVVMRSKLRVNSIHHQAVASLGNGLRAVAHAPDGVIEAIEFTEPLSFFIGVQWHPEWLIDDPASERLYARLVSEALS